MFICFASISNFITILNEYQIIFREAECCNQCNGCAAVLTLEATWLDSRQRHEANHVSKASRAAARPTHDSTGVKWPGHEADHSHIVPSLRISGAVPPVPNMPPWPAQR